MNRLRKFIYLSFSEQCLVTETFIFLFFIRSGFWFFRFEFLRKFLSGLSPKAALLQKEGKFSKKKLIWAVEVTARFFPFLDTCLIKAMCLELLFKKQGYPALLCIGVAKNPNKKFEAHAWVESEGAILMGGDPVFQASQLT